jgi:hypothetical protein
MKLLTVFFATMFLLMDLTSAQDKLKTIKPSKSYEQSGVKFVSPNQTDWQIVKSENLETSLVRMDTIGKYNIFVKTKTIDLFENVEALFINLEKAKQAEISSLDRDSLHFNRVNFQETPCLQYDGIFNAKSGNEVQSQYKYFNMSGYLCRHPAAKDTIIQFEFSNYSNQRGFSETENKLSREFFDKLKFVKVKGQ